ncbi:hypothetical protein OFR75_02230 [Brachyspira hyodysenteriae]|nr:hypothetical protein [Brachyspira hyodysenteriae]
MIEDIINSYNTDRDLSDIDVLLDLLIELETLELRKFVLIINILIIQNRLLIFIKRDAYLMPFIYQF